MRFLPLGIDVRGRSCVVVGGGPVGTRKAVTLARAGAQVTVVSPVVSRGLAQEIAAGSVHWVAEPFAEHHVAGAFLVVMATDDKALNAIGAGVAARERALVCDASAAQRSTATFAALLQDGGVTVATFTDGKDPSAARKKRDEIRRLLEEAKAP